MQEDTIKQEDLDLKDINTVIKHEDAEIKKAGVEGDTGEMANGNGERQWRIC